MSIKYVKIPEILFTDNRLQTEDKLLLAFLFGRKKGKTVNLKRKEVIESVGIIEKNYYNSLERLKKTGWLKYFKEDEESTEYLLELPQLNTNVYNSQGSRITREWPLYFGTRLIKYEDLQDLLDFIKQGMEEELVLKVMEYGGQHAKGDPFKYTRAILMDLVHNGVYTLVEYEKHNSEGESYYGKQISKNNSPEENGTEDEIANEYYKKGYR